MREFRTALPSLLSASVTLSTTNFGIDSLICPASSMKRGSKPFILAFQPR